MVQRSPTSVALPSHCDNQISPQVSKDIGEVEDHAASNYKPLLHGLHSQVHFMVQNSFLSSSFCVHIPVSRKEK